MFVRNRDRVNNRHKLVAELTATFATDSVAHWCALLKARGVPVSPIRHLDEIYTDPHTQAINMIGTVDHHTGPLSQIRFPVNFCRQRPTLGTAPPTHGQHTQEVLDSLER